MKKIISIITITLTVLIASCVSEDRFEKMNITPNAITDAMMAQDFSFGTRFNSIFQNLTAGQSGEEHNSDTYCRHFATPSIFQNNINGATYGRHITWNNTLWNRHYNNVMAPCLIIKEMALKEGLILFAAWAELFQVTAMSRLTTYHGPLIYSEYGQKLDVFVYDSEEHLYQQFFDKLDEIQAVFKANLPTGNTDADAGKQKIDARFDRSYGGDLAKWLKYINSLRLRLAMRLVKVDADWAEEMWKQAVSDPVEVILTNVDNFNTSLYDGIFPHWQISNDWTDTRMGSGMEEVLLGYNDPRLYVWWQPVAGGDELYADHPTMPYKGIAGGAHLEAKAQRTPYSALGTYFNNSANKLRNFRRFLTAEEVHFACAEAALRGWPTPGNKTAQQWYEDGVRLSFNEWGITDNTVINAYLNNNTSMPIDYVDPLDTRNSYLTRMTDPEAYTIKWRDDVSDEKKLERIMMQKWLGSFVNTNEMWSDFRRTGYPKLHYNPKNDSNETWGIIEKDADGKTIDFNKRELFIDAEIRNNADGIKETEKKMSGPNKISTRLWIHPDLPNF